MPNIFNASSIEEVALESNFTFFTSIYFDNSSSNSLLTAPLVIQPDFNTLTTAFISLSVISGGENGIFFFINLSYINFIYYLLIAIFSIISTTLFMPIKSLLKHA